MKKLKNKEEEGEDFNVRTEHGQIMREFSEPKEVYRAIPWWLKHGLYAPLCIWFIWYLAFHFGRFNSNEYYEGGIPIAYDVILEKEKKEKVLAEQKAQELSKESIALPLPDGAKVYAASCSVCHQPNGQGLAGVFPPLAGSDWISGDADILAALVLHGLQGSVVVNGTTYNGVMPPQGGVLEDPQIAAVLTHVRSSWGNKAEPVTAEAVEKIRVAYPNHEPWTKAKLEAAFTK